MCGSCVSTAESLVLGAAGASTAAAAAVRRVGEVLRGRPSLDRQAAAYAANAAFLRSLGHDPAVVLGPPPVIGPAAPSRAAAPPAMVGP